MKNLNIDEMEKVGGGVPLVVLVAVKAYTSYKIVSSTYTLAKWAGNR